jgi:uncharacterized membrane protein YtjA (UPF0391 family)
MLHWSLVFLVIAILAAILGFGGIAGTAAGIAKILFFVFLVIWLIAFISGRRAVEPSPGRRIGAGISASSIAQRRTCATCAGPALRFAFAIKWNFAKKEFHV